MTITTRDQLIDALANNSSRIVWNKASLASGGVTPSETLTLAWDEI